MLLYRIQLYKEEKGFEAARNECQQHDAELAEIESRGVNKKLVQMMLVEGEISSLLCMYPGSLCKTAGTMTN